MRVKTNPERRLYRKAFSSRLTRLQHCINVEGEYLRECYKLEQLGQKLSEIFPFEQV